MLLHVQERFRTLRRELKLSQEAMAEKLNVSQKHIYRIERGIADVDMWTFISMMEMLGKPTEDYWLLFLEGKEYEDYNNYKELRRVLRNENRAEAEVLYNKLKASEVAEKPFLQQFLTCVRITLDTEMTPEDAIGEARKALEISIPDFREADISQYALTYNEISFLLLMASKYSQQENYEKAIHINEGILKARERFRVTPDDVAAVMPVLVFNLSNLYGKSKDYRTSLKYSAQALDMCKGYNNLYLVPEVLHNMALDYVDLGEPEDMYKPLIKRAYYSARAHSNNELANKIKKYAEEKLGISDLD